MNQHLQFVSPPVYPQYQLQIGCDPMMTQWSSPVQHAVQNVYDMSPFLSPLISPIIGQVVPNTNVVYQQPTTTNFIHNVPSPVWQPSHYAVNLVTTDSMTVEKTAEWIRMLGHSKNWELADEYAEKFAENDICGSMLHLLTHEGLKSDLGIKKYCHRLEIMDAIRVLFPNDTVCSTTGMKTEGNDQVWSPTWESITEESEAVLSVYRSQSEIQRTCRDERVWRTDGSRPISTHTKNIEPDYQAKEVSKWVGIRKNLGQCSSKAVISMQNQELRAMHGMSDRARPGNPVTYKTLRIVKVRSGKYEATADVCTLPKGSIVTINQIKGRSGRVVLPQDGGHYVKLGWVTLYTKNGLQLLKKTN